MSFQFGGGSSSSSGKSTQTVLLPPSVPGQDELTALNVQLAKEQLAQLQAASSEANALKGTPGYAAQQQLQELAVKNLIARLTGQAPVLSPEEQARLDEIYGTAQSQGSADLRRSAEDAAAMRGMSISDSPIGNEYLKQQRLLTQSLNAQKSASALDLGNAQQNFNASINQFQQQLQQQALMNRLAIAGATPASYGLQAQLFGQQLGAAGRMGTGRQSGTQSTWGAGLSGSDASGYGTGAKGLWGTGGAFA